jgi:hypothetical protein
MDGESRLGYLRRLGRLRADASSSSAIWEPVAAKM